MGFGRSVEEDREPGKREEPKVGKGKGGITAMEVGKKEIWRKRYWGRVTGVLEDFYPPFPKFTK